MMNEYIILFISEILHRSEFMYISHDPAIFHNLLLNCPYRDGLETSFASIKFRKRASSLSLVSFNRKNILFICLFSIFFLKQLIIAGWMYMVVSVHHYFLLNLVSATNRINRICFGVQTVSTQHCLTTIPHTHPHSA